MFSRVCRVLEWDNTRFGMLCNVFNHNFFIYKSSCYFWIFHVKLIFLRGVHFDFIHYKRVSIVFSYYGISYDPDSRMIIQEIYSWHRIGYSLSIYSKVSVNDIFIFYPKESDARADFLVYKSVERHNAAWVHKNMQHDSVYETKQCLALIHTYLRMQLSVHVVSHIYGVEFSVRGVHGDHLKIIISPSVSTWIAVYLNSVLC